VCHFLAITISPPLHPSYLNKKGEIAFDLQIFSVCYLFFSPCRWERTRPENFQNNQHWTTGGNGQGDQIGRIFGSRAISFESFFYECTSSQYYWASFSTVKVMQ
jgi:hypothetical protein